VKARHAVLALKDRDPLIDPTLVATVEEDRRLERANSRHDRAPEVRFIDDVGRVVTSPGVTPSGNQPCEWPPSPSGLLSRLSCGPMMNPSSDIDM
jgi:hypothetical protein